MVSSADFRRALPRDATVSRWRGPDGWDFRRFDWPAAEGASRRGRMLFQGGRGDVFEKYLESFAHWHARGWSITSLDWRGQGGSGRVGGDARVGHVGRFADYLGDLEAFWAGWRGEDEGECGGPRVLLGHSMGGFLGLGAIVEGRVRPDAAVLVAPMLGLRSPLGVALGSRIARFMARRGDPARPAWRANERPGSFATRQALLTGDLTRYEDEGWWHAQVPGLRLGPPSWHWLAEAFGVTRALAADPRLSGVRVPVLMLVAEADGLVDARAAVRIAARMPTARVHRFGRESAHEILREADPVRDRALTLIDDFLDDVAAVRAPA